jgi:3-oxoacyl-[acyl-carrier protein] reductase
MSQEVRDIKDTVVVVTGAGSGIGLATATALLESGAKVVAADIKPESLDQLVTKFGNNNVIAVGADARSPRDNDAIIEAGVKTWGKVESIVCNAGIGFYGGLLDYDEDKVRMMAEVNFLGTVWLTRSALPEFRRRNDGGDIVIVASVAGMGVGGAKESVYAGTKAAQIQYAQSLQREVRTEKIRVTTIAPAAANTAFAAADGRFGAGKPEDADFLKPADIAGAIVATLKQPRRMRTSLWSIWSLAENG